MKAAIGKAGAKVAVVAPKVGSVKLSDNSIIKADAQLQGAPSHIFDAVAVLVSREGAQALAKEASSIQWVMDAFSHLKAIGHSAEAKLLLEKAGVVPDEEVTDLGKHFVAAAAKRCWAREESVRTLV